MQAECGKYLGEMGSQCFVTRKKKCLTWAEVPVWGGVGIDILEEALWRCGLQGNCFYMG